MRLTDFLQFLAPAKALECCLDRFDHFVVLGDVFGQRERLGPQSNRFCVVGGLFKDIAGRAVELEILGILLQSDRDAGERLRATAGPGQMFGEAGLDESVIGDDRQKAREPFDQLGSLVGFLIEQFDEPVRVDDIDAVDRFPFRQTPSIFF